VRAGQPIDVVLNEQSKRKTSNIIGFKAGERFFGYPAEQKVFSIFYNISKVYKISSRYVQVL
jgi:hypothetical protein